MKRLNILAALLLIVAGLQTAWGQGFRVYQSDGTVAQFSLRTDSIVFYDGIGSDQDFGPFTPVNQFIAGTWYTWYNSEVNFNEDGTTNYIEDATYEFLPYQGTIIFYNTSGVPISILKVYKVTKESIILNTLVSSQPHVLTRMQPDQLVFNGHEYIDLGLPSGTLWAACNVGANTPEEYGDYYAWGETQPKSEYSWATYRWMNNGQSDWNQINKYTFADGKTNACWYNDNTFIGDGKTELEPDDDAATANWGYGWQMPSLVQWKELIDSNYTTIESYTMMNGISGALVVSKINGNRLFLPISGYRQNTKHNSGSYYWSRSLGVSDSSHAYYLYLNNLSTNDNPINRLYGLSVRPVRVP